MTVSLEQQFHEMELVQQMLFTAMAADEGSEQYTKKIKANIERVKASIMEAKAGEPKALEPQVQAKIMPEAAMVGDEDF